MKCHVVFFFCKTQLGRHVILITVSLSNYTVLQLFVQCTLYDYNIP